MQVRYDERAGIYRDCKWCGGRGCLACPAEAEKEYKRQFPDGPKPIATIPLSEPIDLDTKQGQDKLKALLKEHLPEHFGDLESATIEP